MIYLTVYKCSVIHLISEKCCSRQSWGGKRWRLFWVYSSDYQWLSMLNYDLNFISSTWDIQPYTMNDNLSPSLLRYNCRHHWKAYLFCWQVYFIQGTLYKYRIFYEARFLIHNSHLGFKSLNPSNRLCWLGKQYITCKKINWFLLLILLLTSTSYHSWFVIHWELLDQEQLFLIHVYVKLMPIMQNFNVKATEWYYHLCLLI